MSDALRVNNIHFGNVASNHNQAHIGFTSVGIGSTGNYGALQFVGVPNTLCWTANGTVGIGTTNPTAALDVNGSSSAVGLSILRSTAISGSGRISYYNNTGSVAYWLLGSISSLVGNYGGTININGDLVRVDTALKNVQFGCSVNYGVFTVNRSSASGTTGTPNGNIVVYRNATTSLYDVYLVFGSYSSFVGDVIYSGATINLTPNIVTAPSASGTYLLAWDHSVNSYMAITNSGNVGIGKTNPTTALDVVGAISLSGNFIKYGTTNGNDLRIEGGTATNSGYVNFVTGGTSRGYIGNASATDVDVVAQNGTKLNFYTAGANRMTINTVGQTDFYGNVAINNGVGGSLMKYGNTSGYYATFTGGTAINSPFLEFWANGFRRCYMGNASTTEVQFASENGAQLNFLTAGTSRMTINTSGNASFTGNVGVSGRLQLAGTSDCEIYNGNVDTYNSTGNNNLMIRSWWGIGFPSYDNIVRIGMDTRTGSADFTGDVRVGNNITMQITKPLYLYYISSTNHAGFITESSGNMNLFTGTGGVANRLTVTNGGFVGISTTAPLARLTIRNGYSDGDTGGVCIDATDGSVYNMRLSSFVQGTSQVAYRFGVNNGTSSSPNTLVLGFNGNIGIGTDNPQVPLHIPRSSNISVGGGGFYFSTGTSIIGWPGNGNLATSIRVSDAIVTGASFIAASDIRVKKNIQPVLNSLQIIDQLNIVSYDKIDYIGTGVDAGIIAQDIQDILPRTISKHTSFIPNIYQCATYEYINDNEIRVNVTCNDKDVKEGGRVQLKIVKGDKEDTYEASLHQLTGTSFVIKKWSDFSNDHKVFVYGTEVDDFLSVDKEQIGMLAAAGVKELYQVVKEQQAAIVSLQSQLATVLARIAVTGTM